MSSSRLDRLLFWILLLIILSGIIAFIYSIAVPATSEKFTEFYLLGDEGKAGNYPEILKAGNKATVVVGIINREQETTNYSLGVRINGEYNKSHGPIVLEHNEKWEEEISFQPEKAGDKQKVEFLLFKSEQSEHYLSLHLLINVSEPGANQEK